VEALGVESGAYSQKVVETFAALKEIDSEADLAAATLPLDDHSGSLVPICRLHELDAGTIELLARWRVRNMAAYPTQFTVTTECTARWLRELVLDVPDRIAFLVVDTGGSRIGHVGLGDALAAERVVRLDNIMRGTDDGPRGIMSAAVRTLVVWARGAIAPTAIWVKLFSDNAVAIRFYTGLGFRPEGMIPLRESRSPERIEYVPMSAAGGHPDRYHVRMVLPDGIPGPSPKKLAQAAQDH
jgi:perosamine synthetase